ncbi:hypothetical protein K438DRAFT_2010155 [Mycena galopus ATCC 62051]|nr:hypothetical protein K438DRAFT_2010155 [Mycena galopus ATCC 62051]
MDPGDADYAPLPFTDDEFPLKPRKYSTTNRVATEYLRTLRVERWRLFGRDAPIQLDMLLQMHIDIVLAVLSFLHPLDLLHLSRTNREFRAFLHGPALDRIWRESFIEPLPVCPSEIPARRWAHLLFGAYSCEECGRGDTLPDFAVLRRLCTECMDQLLWDLNGRASPCLLIFPMTLRGVGNRWDQESHPRALLSEALAVMDEYSARVPEDKKGEPWALSALQFFKDRSDIVLERYNIRMQSDQWIRAITTQIKARDAENLKKIQATVEKRLLAEGHDLRDIETARFIYRTVAPLSGITRLSSKRWNKTRREVLPTILWAKEDRLEDEFAERQTVVQKGISGILRARRTPSTWAYTPSVQDIAKFSEFHELIVNQDETLAPDDSRLVAALERLPARLDSWLGAERTSLVAKIPSGSNPPDRDVLEFATTVFGCANPSNNLYRHQCCLVGWKDAGAHRERGCNVSSVTFSESASTAACALVRLVGLDPRSATADHMDALDARFICDDCPIEQHGRKAMGWRICLLHASQNAPSNKTDSFRHISSWSLLSPPAANDIRRREGKDPTHVDSIWLCNLCPAHFRRRVKREDVVKHVSAKHDMAHATEGVHFLQQAGAYRSARAPVFLSCGPHATEYHCNQCATETPHVKLMSLRAVVAHVRDKHGSIVTGKGYTKVERLVM